MIVVLGAGESGIGAALLSKKKGSTKEEQELRDKAEDWRR